jgi:hypothetical protein
MWMDGSGLQQVQIGGGFLFEMATDEDLEDFFQMMEHFERDEASDIGRSSLTSATKAKAETDANARFVFNFLFHLDLDHICSPVQSSLDRTPPNLTLPIKANFPQRHLNPISLKLTQHLWTHPSPTLQLLPPSQCHKIPTIPLQVNRLP